MATKKNTAQVAAQAKPCRKQADPVDFPTLQQIMLLALSLVQSSLEQLERVSRDNNDLGPSDVDVDVDLAVSLALGHIKRFRANLPVNRDAFDEGWLQLGSVINLSLHATGNPGTYYSRLLGYLKNQFDVFADAVEFVDKEARCGL